MPILINQNTVNSLTFTLTEKTTLSAPIYLFQFRNVTEKVSYYCIMADISLYKERYNEFLFTEGTDLPLIGELILGAGGQYEYFVYEQLSTTNLDPTLSTGLVESGLIDFDRGQTTYNQHTIDQTYKTHQVT
tara:strand:+ start:166 stop:561 length:396 start_codon:yes stop_codon:yes gene_type:complete